jgi:2-dehydropantoate 2-reductase
MDAGKRMKIAIIGSGGVGGYFGACIARAGFDVTFLARGAHLQAMWTNGLQVKSIKGDFTVRDIRITDKIGEIVSPDLVLVCVKAWQIREVRSGIAGILHEDSLVLPLQNGVTAADELCEVISRKNVIGGLCRIISKIESPGVISHFGVNPFIAFGETEGSATVRLHPIKEIFDRAGIDSRISEDIQSELWKKFIAICVSGLLAVSSTTYGEIRSLPETRKMMIDLFTEIWRLARKIGINIEEDFVEKTVSFIDTFPPDSTSSLTRDVLDGKPSEIEYQNGTVVRLAEQYGLEAPVNRFVYNCILPREIKVRSR